jgi:hypothetical protein
MKAVILGDTHGKFKGLSFAIKRWKDEVDVVIQVGDFGFWPRWDYDIEYLKTYGKKIYFVDGNHEDHHELRPMIPKVETLGDLKPIEIHENVFYVPRGCIFSLEGSDVKLLGVGGAKSNDTEYRKEGWDVFSEVERPTFIEMEQIMMESDRGADVLLSHTIPDFCFQYLRDGLQNHEKTSDPTCKFLSDVVEAYGIKKVFAGHWHDRNTIVHNDITVEILANIEGRVMKNMWMTVEL